MNDHNEHINEVGRKGFKENLFIAISTSEDYLVNHNNPSLNYQETQFKNQQLNFKIMERV